MGWRTRRSESILWKTFNDLYKADEQDLQIVQKMCETVFLLFGFEYNSCYKTFHINICRKALVNVILLSFLFLYFASVYALILFKLTSHVFHRNDLKAVGCLFFTQNIHTIFYYLRFRNASFCICFDGYSSLFRVI